MPAGSTVPIPIDPDSKSAARPAEQMLLRCKIETDAIDATGAMEDKKRRIMRIYVHNEHARDNIQAESPFATADAECAIWSADNQPQRAKVELLRSPLQSACANNVCREQQIDRRINRQDARVDSVRRFGTRHGRMSHAVLPDVAAPAMGHFRHDNRHNRNFQRDQRRRQHAAMK